MTEQQTHKIEQEDIIVPELKKGQTALVLQRHGKYNRDPSADDAGSLEGQDAEKIKQADKAWFRDLLTKSGEGDETFILFVSSDTQYAGNGFRSLETGQLAQDAAISAMQELEIDPEEHILNLNSDFSIARSDETDQNIRPVAGLREPDIFNPDDVSYLEHLQRTHGYADAETKSGMSPKAWGMHEMDAEREVRETTGAEGQQDLIDRTKTSLAILERYARIWHASNPDKKLVIWATSHYDTINPLIKEVDGRLYDEKGDLADEYQPVDYGGGVVLKFPSSPEEDVTLETRAHDGAKIDLGRVATRNPVTRLGLPRH